MGWRGGSAPRRTSGLRMDKVMAGVKATLCLLLLLVWQFVWALDGDSKEDFVFHSNGGKSLRIFTSVPASLSSATPVVFVMHGQRRNADNYRDQWHQLAMKNGFLLIVPEFSQQEFPKRDAYNFGNVLDENGHIRLEDEWSYSLLEPVFDYVRKHYALEQNGYSIYGHSAGAQFVHRFLLFSPRNRALNIVVANAGSYTMPDQTVKFPYGLGGSAVTDDVLRLSLQLPVTILLGDRDIDPQGPSLPSAEEARAQGPHRFARGFSFFEAGRLASIRLDVPFQWHLSTVRGVGHDNALMAPAAVVYLLP